MFLVKTKGGGVKAKRELNITPRELEDEPREFGYKPKEEPLLLLFVQKHGLNVSGNTFKFCPFHRTFLK